MEQIIAYAFDNGALNNIILSVMVIGAMWFISHSWWPDKVKRMDREQEINRELSLRKIDTETEIKKLEVEAQIDIYRQVIADMERMKSAIEGMTATYNDFLQNVLSQFIEDRRELIDTGIFREKEGQ